MISFDEDKEIYSFAKPSETGVEKMKVYIVRHGESVTNFEKKWTGQLDVALTEKGEADARRVGEKLCGVSFDKIYASDLIRAVRTAEIATGKNPLIETRVREIDVGDFAGVLWSDMTDEQRALIRREGYNDFGGESKADFRMRVSSFMKMLENSSDSTVAVFTHAGWLRAFFSIALGVEFPIGRILVNNCSHAVFEYSNGKWALHSWVNL